MQALLYAELSQKTLSQTLDGSAYSWPKLIQGDTMAVGLRWTQRQDGKPVEVTRTLTGLRVSIGTRDARPTRGRTRFQIGNPATTPAEGTNLTTALPHNFTAGDLQDALNALSAKPGAAAVVEDAGTFLITFAEATDYTTITARNNRLGPFAIADVDYYTQDAEFITTLRLVQTPAAFVDSWANVLPPPPSITTIQNGFEDESSKLSEVQEIYRPPAFRGTYVLKRDGRESKPLTQDSDVERLKEALAGIADDGGEFTVEELDGQNASQITFGGTMAGINQDLIEVEVKKNPPGDPTFLLDLGRANMAAALRGARNGEIKLPLEIEASFENEADDSKTDVITFSAEVTIVAEVTLSQLASPANIDFLRPPSPVNYEAQGAGQINSGVLFYSRVLDTNGSATVFNEDHDLASNLVFPFLRQNHANGEILRYGVDFKAREGATNNTIIITLLGDYADTPPEAGELLFCAFALGAASQYSAHTHSIAEITGLLAILNAHAASIAALEALIPIGSIASDSIAGSKNASINFATLAGILEAFPSRTPIATATQSPDSTTTKTTSGAIGTTTEQVSTTTAQAATELASLADLDLNLLPNDGGLLPAVLDAKAEALTVPLPAASTTYKGRVFLLGGSADVVLPGGGGRRSTTLKPGQYATCDGKYWYRVIRAVDTEPNWYPFDFDRELFLLAITDKDLSLKRQLDINLGFEVAVMTRRGLTAAEYQRTQAKNTVCQWQLVIEWGLFTTEAAAAGVAFTVPDHTNDKIVADIDNCPDGTPVKLTTTDTLPGGLGSGLYYTRDTSGNERKLAATLGGSAINITSAGAGTHTITPQIASNNLKSVAWNSTPMLAHTFRFTRDAVGRQYGVRIKRSLVSNTDTITAEQIVMGNSSAAGSAPSGASFALRGRLIRFDTQDDVVDPRALVVLYGLDREVIKGDADVGKVILKSA